MGSNSSREARGPGSLSPNSHQHDGSGGNTTSASPGERTAAHPLYASRTPGRSRPDLSFLGLGSTSNTEHVPERRETKQERERRKLEKERAARVKERERSLKEEHVDGGYLVTMGVYTGIEDFNKGVVRQFMIERRIAPFWRGLDDFNDEWTEHQLVAAGRGLPIPKADEIPPEELTRSGDSTDRLNQKAQKLMVPITSRSHSAASDASTNLSPSHPAFSGSSSTGPASPQSSSPFRPRSKTLASLTTSSKTSTSTDMVLREIQLPKDPFVNGQAIEVFLYKDATECPICFLYYPPYLNKTRCCDQAICSECFVQIKRPDPHPPEHEHADPSNPTPPPPDANVDPESLVSEPATCPYCQQPEFGVTYDPPQFRRGLAYASGSHGLGSFHSAMSSSSSLNSAASPTTAPTSPPTHKRRTTSISANASTVVTTDKVRPDWATKLANARNHLARRSAAATALHTAAYLIGNGSTDQRSFGFGGRSRFGRNRGESSPGNASGTATPSGAEGRNVTEQAAEMRREAQAAGGRRRSRMDDLEDMMMMEAIRLSLAAEEDRKRKAERDAAKDAKKRAKEEKKREKKERRVYGSGHSSASGSALSLSLPGIGRRRGNSGASMLQNQITPETLAPSSSKGKAVDRSGTSAPSATAPIDFPRAGSSTGHGFPGARHLDANTLSNIGDTSLPSPSPTAPEKPSHLRQMSNASSPASSFVETPVGSLKNGHVHGSSSSIDTPNASGTNVAGSSDNNGASGGSGSESLFNFQSLVAMIGKDEKEDKDDVARHIEYLSGGETSKAESTHVEHSGLEESVATLKVSNNNSSAAGNNELNPDKIQEEPERTTPELMVTPETPAAVNENDKQLGSNWNGVAREIAQ